MPVGGYFRGLTSFDLLGNLIPGVAAASIILGFLPASVAPSNVGEYALFAASAFIIGIVLQSHASWAAGQRISFDETMKSAEVFSDLADETGGENKGEEGILANLKHAFLGPIFSNFQVIKGERLDDRILVNRIWKYLTDKYNIPQHPNSYPVIYHLMSSKVDNINSPSHATRIQAIRNFHRGMWIASWYSVLLIGIAVIGDHCFNQGQSLLFGISYRQPMYFEYWSTVWHFVPVAVVSVVVFWRLYGSYEEDYIEYLFADYAVAIEGNSLSIEPTGAKNTGGQSDKDAEN